MSAEQTADRSPAARLEHLVRRNYGRMPTRALARALGTTSVRVVGTARRLGLVAPVVWTAREEALLRRHYRSGDGAATTALVELTRKTRDQVKKRARALGLADAKPADWTREEEGVLADMWGRYPDRAVARRLGRTVLACALKAKRLGRSRQGGTNGWNLRELGRLMGVDGHACARWVDEGRLVATVASYRLGGAPLRIVGEASLLKFLRSSPECYDWRRMGDPSGYYRRIGKEASAALLSTADVAARYGVARNTASRWIAKGWLPAVRGCRTGGKGNWYVREADLAGWSVPRPELVGHRGRGKAGASAGERTAVETIGTARLGAGAAPGGPTVPLHGQIDPKTHCATAEAATGEKRHKRGQL